MIPRWRTVNITRTERAGRILLGLAAIVGVVFLTSAASVVAVVLFALLVLAGADLAGTGALGHCALYQKLGFVPPSLRRPRSCAR
ncbi:DUF2892 domain-containing protein [Amycolatopsis sp. K13G38]|uniref:DUF2892 domain-containing protein n=1 Tax=Amycolatopsis acididurans TaxID=2724524 RepID=A0ABX1J792_9PSEU|nr:DUF2892 domain-containing protein [Amycolatopsis acididurans]